jgi:hypothetical protein
MPPSPRHRVAKPRRSPPDREKAFAELLSSRPGDLESLLETSPPQLNAVIERVVRSDRGLGPITLGEGGAGVLDRLARLPVALSGFRPQVHPDLVSLPGHAEGTDAHHLEGDYSLAYDSIRPQPHCWLEWASDSRTDRIIEVRFCVISDQDCDIQEPLVAAFRQAFDASYGPGTERKKKPRKHVVRPIDWWLDTAVLTVGSYQWRHYRLVICELLEETWSQQADRPLGPMGAAEHPLRG